MDKGTIGEKIAELFFRVGENEKDIQETKSILAKLGWIVITAVIAAVLGLVLRS